MFQVFGITFYSVENVGKEGDNTKTKERDLSFLNKDKNVAKQNEAPCLKTFLLLLKTLHKQHYLCLRLPSCCPRFESQAHNLCFYQFRFELCHVEKTKINKKRPGLAHLKNCKSHWLSRHFQFLFSNSLSRLHLTSRMVLML